MNMKIRELKKNEFYESVGFDRYAKQAFLTKPRKIGPNA
jgi:hypothetical protein